MPAAAEGPGAILFVPERLASLLFVPELSASPGPAAFINLATDPLPLLSGLAARPGCQPA